MDVGFRRRNYECVQRYIAVFLTLNLRVRLPKCIDYTKAPLTKLSRLLTSAPHEITSARTLSDAIVPQLQTCPSDTYIIVSQPGVDASDYADKRAAPLLRKMVIGNDERIRSSLSAREVLGRVDGEDLSRILREECEAGLLRVDASSKDCRSLTWSRD